MTVEESLTPPITSVDVSTVIETVSVSLYRVLVGITDEFNVLGTLLEMNAGLRPEKVPPDFLKPN